MTYVLAAVLIVLTTLPVLDAARRKGAFARPEFYLLGVLYLYGTGGYLTYLLFSSQDFTFLLAADRLTIHASYLFAALAVYAVYVGGKLYWDVEPVRLAPPGGRTLVILASLGCVIAIGFNAYYYASYGLFSGAFDRVLFIDEFKPREGFTFPYMTVLLASLPILALNERRPVSWLFLLAFALLHLPVGDRRVVIAALIVLIVAKLLRGLRLRKRAVVPALAVILVLGVVIGIARGSGLSALYDLDLSGIFLALSEFARPFVTLVYYVGNGYEPLYGASIIQSFANVVPGFLLPFDKFPAPGEQFVETVESLGVYPTRVPGFGFYPVTEALLNFGPIGIPAFFLLFAWLIRKLSSLAVGWGFAFVVPVLCAAMFSFGRSSLTNVVVTNFWVLAFGGSICLAAWVLTKGLAEGRRRFGKGKRVEG